MNKDIIYLIWEIAVYATDLGTIEYLPIIMALLELSYNVVRNDRRNGTYIPLYPICYKVNQKRFVFH